ncbi:hypothetical protein U6G28_03165 [Actinomycetaceae bacterium MB13-C1-2]|nr:hypothetical protein U6G28_03165 [Actinomycetaceae bacterium MB13-C1-2]
MDAQSDDLVAAVNDAVGNLPWIVPVLLVVMILTGVVLLVARLRGNSRGPGWDLRSASRGPGRK